MTRGNCANARARRWPGSGTIFFANCNMACAFCQNCEISHGGEGDEVDDRDLAGIMLRLQRRGCHNINLVSPSHVVPQILEALEIAAAGGLEIPLVWNTGGYDALPSLRLLDGIVDIYMPDMKFAEEKVADRIAAARGYPKVNRLGEGFTSHRLQTAIPAPAGPPRPVPA